MSEQQQVYESSNLPFDKCLAQNVVDLLDRVKLNKASMIIIDGGIGEGKTTLAVHLANYINSLNGLPPIALDIRNHPQLAMGGREFVSSIKQCYEQNLPVVIYDESGDYNRKGALSTFNAMLDRTFETYRAFKILVILTLPNMTVLENSLFYKNIPRLVVHCYSRTENYGCYRGYSLYRALFVKDKMRRLVVKSYAYEVVNPSFYGQFHNLSPVLEKKLNDLTIAGKLQILQTNELGIHGLIDKRDIARRIGRTTGAISAILNKLKIKPERIVGRRGFYSESIVELIREKLLGGEL